MEAPGISWWPNRPSLRIGEPASRGLPSGLEAYGLEAAPEGETLPTLSTFLTLITLSMLKTDGAAITSLPRHFFA